MPPFLTIQSRHNPLEKAIQILSDPTNAPENSKYDIITSILHNCDFFTKYFSSPLKLEEFIQLAKHQIEYEFHEFGHVLVKEKDACDKFHILLRGAVQKFHQKAQMELEGEVHEERRRSSVRARIAFGTPSREFTPEIKAPTDRRKSSLKKALISGVNRISLLGRIFAQRNSESPRKRGFSVNTEATMDSQRDETNSPLSAVSTGFSRRARKSKVYYPVQQQDTSRSDSPNINCRHNFSRFGRVQSGLGEEFFTTEDTTTQLDTEEFSQCGESPISDDNNSEKNCVIKFATVKNPDLLATCFLDNVVKVKNIRTYGPGDYFTENFYKTSQPKENSMLVVSSEEAHFLTMTREDFVGILIELEERANQKYKFFHDLFPMFEGQEVTRFSQLFGQQIYSKDELIYSQNDKNDQCVYLLYAGGVKLMTDLSANNKLLPNLKAKGKPSIEEVPVTSVVKGQFFGEESLIKKATREYTAIANSANTIVYYLKPELLKKFNKEYDNFFAMLQGNARGKFAWRKEKADEILVSQLSPANKTRPSIIYTPKAGSSKKPESGSGTVNKRKLMMSLGNAMKTEGNVTFEKSDSYKHRFSRMPNNGRLNTDSDHSSDKPQRSDSPPLKLDPFTWNLRKELGDDKKRVLRAGRSSFYNTRKLIERVSLSTEGSCSDLKAFPNIHMMRTAMNLKNEAVARDTENIQIAKIANIHTLTPMGATFGKGFGNGKKTSSSISVKIFTAAAAAGK